jgi:hypothetical protein
MWNNFEQFYMVYSLILHALQKAILGLHRYIEIAQNKIEQFSQGTTWLILETQ